MLVRTQVVLKMFIVCAIYTTRMSCVFFIPLWEGVVSGCGDLNKLYVKTKAVPYYFSTDKG